MPVAGVYKTGKQLTLFSRPHSSSGYLYPYIEQQPCLQAMSRWPPADLQKWSTDEELFPPSLED